MVNGFLLNNELTDFSFAAADAEGNPIANRVQGGKRPRSSMAPTIVFDANGIPETLTGSPGGSSIIGYTAQSLYNLYDFGLDPQSAAGLPHYQNNNADATSIELPIGNVTADYDLEGLTQDLEERGHVVNQAALESGLGIIVRNSQDGTLAGGADPRRDGTVGGTDNEGDDNTDTSYCQSSAPTTDEGEATESGDNPVEDEGEATEGGDNPVEDESEATEGGDNPVEEVSGGLVGPSMVGANVVTMLVMGVLALIGV